MCVLLTVGVFRLFPKTPTFYKLKIGHKKDHMISVMDKEPGLKTDSVNFSSKMWMGAVGCRLRNVGSKAILEPHQSMDGWVDGWMDEWMDGWIDGWVRLITSVEPTSSVMNAIFFWVHLGWQNGLFIFVIPITCQRVWRKKPSDALKLKGFLTNYRRTWDSITQQQQTTSDFYYFQTRLIGLFFFIATLDFLL